MSEQFNPFQSPRTISEPNAHLPAGVVPFESGHKRATWVIILALAGLIPYCAFIYLDIMQYARLSSPERVRQADKQSIATETLFRRASSYLGTGLGTASFIAFLMWTHRAYRNLLALGATRLKSTPGWSVGLYFIPILNLFRPYQTTVEIWRWSDPELSQPPASSGLVAFWWGAFILRLVIGFAVGLLVGVYAAHHLPVNGAAPTVLVLPKDLQMQLALVNMAISTLGILGTFFKIMMVRRIDANQEERNRRLSGTDIWGPATSRFSAPLG